MQNDNKLMIFQEGLPTWVMEAPALNMTMPELKEVLTRAGLKNNFTSTTNKEGLVALLPADVAEANKGYSRGFWEGIRKEANQIWARLSENDICDLAIPDGDSTIPDLREARCIRLVALMHLDPLDAGEAPDGLRRLALSKPRRAFQSHGDPVVVSVPDTAASHVSRIQDSLSGIPVMGDLLSRAVHAAVYSGKTVVHALSVSPTLPTVSRVFSGPEFEACCAQALANLRLLALKVEGLMENHAVWKE